MKEQKVKIDKIDHVTHDTLRIVTEKPVGHTFKPGQATDVAIDIEGWRSEKRPFTFTSLPEDDHLEFIIKTYPENDGATDKLLELKEGNHLILGDVFGSITHKGKGTFIAGGAGVTPFVSILRDLKQKNQLHGHALIFGNKKEKDIILHEELREMLGENFINILSEEKNDKYAHGLIDKEFIREHSMEMNDYFYVCGTPEMTDNIVKELDAMGIDKDKIVKEE